MIEKTIPYTVSERRFAPWAVEPVNEIGARTNLSSERDRTVSWA